MHDNSEDMSSLTMGSIKLSLHLVNKEFDGKWIEWHTEGKYDGAVFAPQLYICSGVKESQKASIICMFHLGLPSSQASDELNMENMTGNAIATILNKLSAL